ncbi:MAG TPA: hypothetical protein VD833_01055 [Vicinamibacterales bacterium]|nr:hypothetical protein [Vicinamibacterales bacterium]
MTTRVLGVCAVLLAFHLGLAIGWVAGPADRINPNEACFALPVVEPDVPRLEWQQ